MVSGNQINGDPNNASVVLDDSAMAVGLGLVEVVGTTGSVLKAIGVSARANVKTLDIPWSTPPPIGKRISWREVVR
jgi:hypothetical protein